MAVAGRTGRTLRWGHTVGGFSDQRGRPAGVTKDGRRVGVSRQAIADAMECSVRTVDRARADHERIGLTVVERRPGRPSVYHLCPREGTEAWRHVQMRRERAAAARARGHKGRVTDPPGRPVAPFTCDVCGWSGAAGPCQATHEDRGP